MVVPGVTPHTTPVDALTVPTAVLLLLHVPVPPDAVVLLKVIHDPAHTDAAPFIVPAIGDTFTVILVVVVTDPQKTLVSVKVIVVVPTAIPPTTPVADPIVPIPGLLLLQVPVPPDAVKSFSVIVEPTHTALRPLISPAVGDMFTVTFIVVIAVPQDALVSV